MALDPIIPGERYDLFLDRVSGDPFDPATTPVTVVIDSPKGERRLVKKHLNGGTDGTVESGGVRFRFTPAETGAMAAYPGKWLLAIAVGLTADHDVLREPQEVLVKPMPAGSVQTPANIP